MLMRLVSSIPPLAERLMQAFLPGPLTLVLKARYGLPKELTGGPEKIGIRISSHPLITRIFASYPDPFTTTSANPTGLPAATDARKVLGYFPDGIDLILDGGPVSGGVASTVIDLTGPEPVVIRDGAITRKDLSRVIGTSFVR
jgi:L-threonylcarbamoyladenylate synthase